MKSDTPRSRRSYPMALCALGMAAIAVFVLVWWGVTPLTAIVAVALLACPVAGLYAWCASRRAEREIDATRFMRRGP
jgi:Flp pilus assembly protein TadB